MTVHIINTTKTDPYKAIDPSKPGKQIIRNKDTGKVLKVITVCDQEQKADQSFAEMHDVNNLLKDAMRRGILKGAATFSGEMDDYPDYDFQEAQFMMAND